MSQSAVLEKSSQSAPTAGADSSFKCVESDIGAGLHSRPAATGLQTDLGFVDVSDGLACKAELLAAQQNALAFKLIDYPAGTAVILNREAWYLEKAVCGSLRIISATYLDGVLGGQSVRFGQSLKCDQEAEAEALARLEKQAYTTASAVHVFDSLPLMSVANGALIHKHVIADTTAIMQTLHRLVHELHAAAIMRGSAYLAPASDTCDSQVGSCLAMIEQLRTVASELGVLAIYDSRLRQLGGIPDLWKYRSRNAQTAQKLRLVLDAGAF